VLAAALVASLSLAGGFTPQVDNPWYPLRAGSVYVYRGVKDGKPARDVLSVTARTQVVGGVRCRVVDDRLYLSGRLAERTTDWYAQDKAGNVWYFGESTAELGLTGKVTSRAGSWRAGVDGARPGIFMPANPRVGQAGQQEFYRGQAEDHFAVLALAVSVRVPYGSFAKALLTREWTPLEPGTLDHKFYVRGIGTVRELTVKGGDERLDLVSFRR
jgi:hypothetical protein